MCKQPWPGNVRELENAVERALIVSRGQSVRLDQVAREPSHVPPARALRAAARQFERDHIRRVLQSLGNNKAATARALGIGVSSLYRKMEDLGLSKTRTASVGLP